MADPSIERMSCIGDALRASHPSLQNVKPKTATLTKVSAFGIYILLLF